MTTKDKFIELPTFWDITSEKYEKEMEILGKDFEPEIVKGVIYINPEQMVRYNGSSRPDECTVSLSDGDVYRITLSVKDFELALDKFYLRLYNNVMENWSKIEKVTQPS